MDAPRTSWIPELRDDKAALVSALLLVSVILVAVFAPVLTPYDPAAQSLADRLMPPFWYPEGDTSHLLGTDSLGRDVLSRLIFGARISIFVGVAVTIVCATLGTALGLVAGFVGGRADSLIMGIVDSQMAMPGLLLAIMVLAVFQANVATLIFVLVALNWMVYARVIRGSVLSIRENLYVEAARVTGASPARILWRHIAPNLTSPLLTLAVLEFANIILAEAALSFLGLGIQPPDTSWGLDLSIGRAYIFSASWLVTLPGLAISVVVLALNLVASWLRVTADPQEREKRAARAS